MFLHAYSFISTLISPFLRLYLGRRARLGKEEAHRLCERMGVATVKRKPGKLIWLHGVSVGESVSLLSLIHHIAQLYPRIQILVTTGTVTAAHVIANKLPDNAVHQYMPLDVYSWMDQFLRHWKPDVVVITESEIWPNLLTLCDKKQIPIYLINARLTKHSFERWKRTPHIARTLFGKFTKILAQSEIIAERLRFFLLRSSNQDQIKTRIETMPNLKFAAKPLTFDQDHYNELHALTHHRPTWVAASTHPGEEEIILRAFKKIYEQCPKALLLLVPRHPKRSDSVAGRLTDYGFVFARRSHFQSEQGNLLKRELPGDHHSIYLMDTFGELGLAYALSPIALVCGSLIPGIGGHNPIEPAQAGCCVLHGPHMVNAEDICAIMGDLTITVNENTLATTIIDLFHNPTLTVQKGKALQDCVLSQKNNLKQLIQLCTPHLGPIESKNMPTINTNKSHHAP
ncbi:MAG: 3-deoxy-D-manno-octulosonic acid transferase [Alphaproteobacteria bacterium]|nr:3-deoxy-D-manno-octulosonic acid transferase [Alphaproteobacteria bacterium]